MAVRGIAELHSRGPCAESRKLELPAVGLIQRVTDDLLPRSAIVSSYPRGRQLAALPSWPMGELDTISEIWDNVSGVLSSEHDIVELPGRWEPGYVPRPVSR